MSVKKEPKERKKARTANGRRYAQIGMIRRCRDRDFL